MQLYLGGYLDFFHPEKDNWLEIEINQPTLLQEVLKAVGIPIGEVNLTVVNGEIVELGEVMITDQDEVKLFSAVGGG